MPPLNNPSSPDTKKIPYLPILNNNSVIQNNINQSHTSLLSTPSLSEVFQSPIQSSNNLSKPNLSNNEDDSINESENIGVGIGTTSSKQFELEPGFVSSNNINKTPNSLPMSNNFSASSFHINNYTPITNTFNNNFISKQIVNNSSTNSVGNINNVSSNLVNQLQNRAISHQSFLQPNTFDSHQNSKFSNDLIGNHNVNEHFDQSHFLNTPTSVLPLQSNLQQQPPPPSQLRTNQYIQFDPTPSSINSHNHSLSIDTLASNHSIKSFSNDEWLNYNNTNISFVNNNTYQPQINTTNNTNGDICNNSNRNSGQLQNCSQDRSTAPSSNQNESEVKLLNKAREYSKYSLDVLSDEIKDVDKMISSYEVTNQKETRSLHIKKKTLNQLFALALLMKNFRISENSICPRNMVYLKYVEVCKKSSLTPICNAAFGKLVKIFNPQIKTRRLGVRGSSRYNYCGIELIENEDNSDNNSQFYFNSKIKCIDSNPNSALTTPIDNSTANSNLKSLNCASIPNNDNNNDDLSQRIKNIPNYKDCYTNLAFQTNLFTNSALTSSSDSNLNLDLSHKLSLDLTFDSNTELDFSKLLNGHKSIKESHKVIINKYSEFLSKLFIDWRYLKIETFFNDIDNFNFRNLLNDEFFEVYETEYLEILPLFINYEIEGVKEFIKLIIKILFQKVPDNVQVGLLNFEKYLIKHVKNMNLKSEIVNEKLKISKILINIIKKFRKIIHLSSSFSKFLSNNKSKPKFVKEWLNVDINELINGSILIPDFQKNRIIEFLKNCFTETIKTLGLKNDLTWEDNESICQDLIINKIANFFTSIPIEFSNVDPKALIMYTEHIGSLILRELTTDQTTSSFSAWWSFLCWSNEYMLLMAEIGSLFRNL